MRARLDAMGPVNMMALEEYKETAERHEFLSTQRKDLLDAIENTAATIARSIKSRGRNLKRRSTRLTRTSRPRSANCSAADMASCGSPISKTARRAALTWWHRLPARSCRTCCCSPAAKRRSRRWRCWSASSSTRPARSAFSTKSTLRSTKANIARFTELVREMSVQTQFILITHSKRTMSIAPVLYGVTMQEPGVSKLVCRCGSGAAQIEEIKKGFFSRPRFPQAIDVLSFSTSASRPGRRAILAETIPRIVADPQFFRHRQITSEYKVAYSVAGREY
jgi:chromosome segregation protein